MLHKGQIWSMRHKMRFVWISILMLMMAGGTLTDGTFESWGFSQLLSVLGHHDHGLESNVIQDRSLSRHRRAASTGSEYILDVEISIPDPSMAIQIKQYLTNELTYPLPLGAGDTNITSIKVTTACNQTGSEVQCSCESGYTWSTDVCTMYTPCPGFSNCSCIKSATFPTQFCQPQTVNINLSLKMLKAFTSDLYDPNSVTYKQYKADLENQFNKSYQSLPGFQSATVTRFRPGSVIADYTVVSEPTTLDTITTANNALITNLASTPYVADSIKTVVPGWSTIDVSPISIYLNDTVTLTCTVNITSYSDVSWYFNTTQKISNDSFMSFTTGSFAGGIRSILRVTRASLSNSGTYKCNIDLSSSSYTAETTIKIHSMELTQLSSVVTCDSKKVPVIQCCTKEGTVTFNLTCQKTSGNIVGISESSSLCQSYTIMADSQSCSSPQSSGFSCTCTTNIGALLQQDVTVTYLTSYQVNVTASSDQISEWTDLTLTCKWDVPSVQNIMWYFITLSNVRSSINTNAYTFNINTRTSTLIIPAANMSVNWNGTFNCEVNGAYSGNKTIVMYRRAKSSEISIFPISKGFLCDSTIQFSCCVDPISAYQPNKTILQIISSTGNSIAQKVMTLSDNCFTSSYIPTGVTCVDLEAKCIIVNLINDNVESNKMLLNVVQKPQCTGPPPDLNINIGVGEAGKYYNVSCQQFDPNLEGTRIYYCNGVTNKWEKSSDNCVSKVLNNLGNQLADLSTSPNPNLIASSVVSQLNDTVSQNRNLTNSVNNIQLVVNILQQVGKAVTDVKEDIMQDFLNTVSIVVDNTTTNTWNQVQNKVSESSNLLKSVESFAKQLVISDSYVSIIKPNVQLIGNIAGNLTSDYKADFNFSQLNTLTGNVVINKTILDQIPKNARVVSVAYATLKDILGVPPNSTSNKTVNSLIMTTVLSTNYSTFSIGMDFKVSNTTLKKPSCVWWNFIIQDWDSSGCQVSSQSTSETVYCVCDHLTSFSILMSASEISKEDQLTLFYITYIGVGISIFSLVACIIIEAMVWKSVTKNKTSYMRHVCIMNIAVTLLMADIWFIIGAALNPTDKVQACVAATFFAHFFYLCVFFWMLTMGMILFYRLMCVFHDLSKTTMMGISFFLGYGCPVIISVITVAVTQPRNIYLTSTSCWLNILDSKAFLAFVIPALTILMVNFITLLVVIIKVLRPSVGDKPKKEEKSSLNHIAKCILILTPLLGLTWGFGIGTLASQSTAIHGIFAALNSLQGLFILLFGCLMDKKVRDALFSRFSISRWSSQQTKTSNLSSTDPAIAKKGINLFGKKGVYNISSAQVNSSSDMASSNSYSLLT